MLQKHHRLYLVSSLLVLLIFAFTALPAHSTDHSFVIASEWGQISILPASP